MNATPKVPHVRVAVIGAGFSGLCLAIHLKQQRREEFVVLERADDLGGAWRDNTYPGCACDVPSNLYSFSFAPNPEWSRTYPPRAEIHRYLRHCAEQYDLNPHLRFGHEVRYADWHGDEERWHVATSQGRWTADLLVSAAGPISDPFTPAIPGLDRFNGACFHSAAWDHHQDLADRRVAVIGTGASAAQLIPEIQPRVASLHVFQRTPPWVLPRWDRAKGRLEKAVFRRFPAVQRLARLASYWGREILIFGLTGHRWALKPAEWLARAHLRRHITDHQMRVCLTPDYTIGCKRLVLSSSYFPALSQPNTELVTEEIREVTRNAITTVDGTERTVDAIILATGFKPANMPIAHRIRGRNGHTLAQEWHENTEAYLGTAVTGFPNLFLLVGPNTVSGQNSTLLTMEAQVDYVIKVLDFMDSAGVSVVEITKESQSAFVANVHDRMKDTVWMSGCRSWYLDTAGRNTTLWPGLTRTFRARTRRFDPTDYSLRHHTPPSLDPPRKDETF